MDLVAQWSIFPDDIELPGFTFLSDDLLLFCQGRLHLHPHCLIEINEEAVFIMQC